MEIKAAVIGSPIKHSLSPKLHNYWLKKYDILGEYNALEILPEDLNKFLESFLEQNLAGINITVPHKETAYKIIEQIGEVSSLAKRIKAINTLYVKKGKLYATNTDYYGFKNSLLAQNRQFSFKGKNILIIGAGGAARAIVGGLIDEEINQITIANRTIDKAKKFKEELSEKIIIKNLENIENLINRADLIINTTSCGLNGDNNLQIDFNKILGKKYFYDIVYKPLMTKFLQDAQNYNHEIFTGIGMLIHQAVPAFEYFFGKKTEVTEDLTASILKL